MIPKRIFFLLILLVIAFLDTSMVRRLTDFHQPQQASQLADAETAIETFRNFLLPDTTFYQQLQETAPDDTGLLLAYLFCQSPDIDVLENWCKNEQQANPEVYQRYCLMLGKLLADVKYFPVPDSIDDQAEAGVSYVDSWNFERTYGGKRRHEGTDIMADIQKRGYYPVISVSDGSVEKIGWLPQGGYRIGIRSPHGVYYYYAHLAEYEEHMKEGLKIKAGQLIGYMGDTGYSEVEGTTGNFPVHLHFGMYLNLESGEELSFNPYMLLRLLESQKLRYLYAAGLG